MIGTAERSAGTRKLSTAYPNDLLDLVEREAGRRGCSAAQVVRDAVAEKFYSPLREAE